ncbi:MAG: phenylalanine--tRNA ligase subunit alpha [Ferruginibacter sp.]
MEDLIARVQQYKDAINAERVEDIEAIENFRIKYLGSKGLVKTILSEMKNVPAHQKKEAGQLLNEFKIFAEEKFAAFDYAKKKPAQSSTGEIDVTLPGYNAPLGTRHPISIVQNKIIEIFHRLGFAVAEGPEIEDDFHNFTALNLPENHPARDMQDTFYIEQNPDCLLRTHTSSVQIREMQKGVLPLRIICPGRVYRNETISARAHCFFHQVEGLYIAEKVSFADLKQTLYFFVREMFHNDIKVRFRPSYFPFTEPSAEMDITCLICNGSGCNVCKKTGYVEILGCGMVHPAVLENCGIDSQKYTGFAFGMGIERITMLKYQVKDLRLFSENDTRFLQQFVATL